jgi:nicotinamidase-related amidase
MSSRCELCSVRRYLPVIVTALIVVQPGSKDAATAQQPGGDAPKLTLHVRKRIETKPGSGRFHAVTETVEWDPAKTALVICDMWDRHWCDNATRRVGEMAPRMNEVAAAARKKGVLVIHCPSDTMDFYKDFPQRKLAQAAPVVETKIPLERSCRLVPEKEGRLPIDDSDGGCDCETPMKTYKAWSRQIPTIRIEAPDAITDSNEAFYLMKQRGIENVLVMGVHTNMCVLARPFSIRQMVNQGQNVVLIRDMTDTMYNPAKAPFVHHCTGTDLVVEHIEKHWCPSVASVDFVGGKEFRFSEDKRPTIAFVIAEDEYKTEETLPAFAAKYLGREFRTLFIFGSETDREDIPGLDALAQADVLFVSARRRVLRKEQLDAIRRFVDSGKPVVGIRTASHAFAAQKNTSGRRSIRTFSGATTPGTTETARRLLSPQPREQPNSRF